MKPEQAVKLAWSDTRVTGPAKFSGQLKAPPSNIGHVRNTCASDYTSDSPEKPFYADSRVVAYRTSAGRSVGFSSRGI